MTWVQEILAALEALGGSASYRDIYSQVEKTTTRNLRKEFRAVIRRTIEEHSSDTTCKKRANYADLFYSVKGIGKGVWGLRASAQRAARLNLEIVTDAAEVSALQARLKASFTLGARRYRRQLGNPGESHGPYTIYWHDALSVWGAFEESETRYWNPFGDVVPDVNHAGTMIVQVNPSRKGLRNTEGVFVRRRGSSEVFIAHRGGIGGSFISESHRFFDIFKGPIVEIIDDKVAERLAIVSSLDDEDVVSRIAWFVHEVSRVKAFLKGDIAESAYEPEFSGARAGYQLDSYVESICFHGDVVNALLQELENRKLAPSRDIHRDAYLPKDGACSILFEVKPTAERYGIYTAVGQVMLHGRSSPGMPALVIVAPELDQGLEQALKGLGIMRLTFAVQNGTVSFPGLDDLLNEALP